MNTSASPSPSVSISKLQEARRIALRDATFYQQIVPSVLPLIGSPANLETRRWGSDFLSETFSSPSLATEQKNELALKVLPTLRAYLETSGQDTTVLKNAVLTATSIYPLVFRHAIYNANDSESWQNMMAIKSNILKRMDSTPSGVKVCCIKFVQRVVQVQTPGLISDPRRPQENETSLALVPSDHPLLSPPNLQAEAFGLLDRLLSVFQENTSDDALIITATLNSVGMLVRMRASVANRILNAILNFNPFRIAATSLTPRTRVMVKSMERTIRAFLINLNKRNPENPLSARVTAYLNRLQQTRIEVLNEDSRKRGAPTEPTDGLDSAKRQRLGAEISETPPQDPAPAMSIGAITLAQLFTLTDDQAYKSFDARVMQWDPLLRALVPLLFAADQTQVDNAVNIVRARYLNYAQAQPSSSAEAAKVAVGDDDDEEYQPMDETGPVLNRVEAAPITDLPQPQPPEVSTGPFVMPQPPPMSEAEIADNMQSIITRVFGMVDEFQDPATKPKQSGFNRLAASNHDRDSWITVVSRLATRSLAGLASDSDDVKNERVQLSVGAGIRESIHRYVIEDFRRRIDVAISWLNEEWYNERVQRDEVPSIIGQYEKHALRVFDGILPYIDAKDNKILIRFLSEIPEITRDILERVKRLARDPERVQLATSALLYLVMFRPPCRTLCLDALQDLYLNYDDAKASSAKILQKWRPEVLQQSSATPDAAPKSETPSAGHPAIVA